jgi:molybdenum cofactor cytidylyltransferase
MPNIGAVILAAGESSRLGQPKQLVHFRGKSLVRRAADAASEAGCSPITIVLGSDSKEIEDELAGTGVAIVKNENWRAGVGTSIRAGVQNSLSQASNLEAIVLLVCDQPFVDARVIKGLIELRQKTSKSIVASAYSGTLGVPALFDRSCFQELRALGNDVGAKSIILSKRERVAEFHFPEGTIDIDTTADLEKLQRE